MSKKEQERDQGTSGPLDELIARFQLETERKIAELAASHLNEIQAMHRRIAQCHDSVVAIDDRCTRFERIIEDSAAAMRAGVTEVNTALRVAVDQARQAKEAADVFEKLKASQPDFYAMVRDLQAKLGQVRTEQANLASSLATVQARLDEFEIVETALEETRVEVRGMQPIVKNLNDLSKRVGR